MPIAVMAAAAVQADKAASKPAEERKHLEGRLRIVLMLLRVPALHSRAVQEETAAAPAAADITAAAATARLGAIIKDTSAAAVPDI